MLKRRTMGPAFERSPAEKIGEWTGRNFLILFAAVVCSIIFCYLTNWMVDDLLNFLLAGQNENVEDPFNSDSFFWWSFKGFGAVAITWGMITAKAS